MLVLTNTAVRGNQLAIAHVPSKWEIRGGKGPFCDWFCMARDQILVDSRASLCAISRVCDNSIYREYDSQDF